MLGRTVSHYHVTEELGKGGMGVVYKATDTKLNRNVALKFLPTHSLPSDDDRARFEREAKAAASLNHPNIATVYEIDESDEGQAFIAMELVEGETLSDKIKRGPLKLEEAIQIASQIAAGLAAAHEKDIVHRDIKASNVMLTDKGQVKIMDFGLAKMAEASMLTVEGTTLGTVFYMSPEQARGEDVDHRADLWALGVVLYEMVSGQLPFAGDYNQAVLYSVLNVDPEALTGLRTGVPMELERIVAKLLMKDRSLRYQSAVEIPADMKAISLGATMSSRMMTTMQTQAVAPPSSQVSERAIPWRIVAPMLVVATALLTFLLTWIFKPSPPLPAPTQPHKMVIPLPENTTVHFSSQSRMAISPDGRDIAFLGIRDGDSRLFLKRAGRFEVIELDDILRARAPFFSPDGRWIGYLQAGDIYKVPVEGGEPFKVTNSGGSIWAVAATWASDRTIIYTEDGALKRIPESGGEPVTLTQSRRGEEWHVYPHMLPDGQTVLFTVVSSAGLNAARLALYRFGDEDYRVILDEESYNAVYSPSGHILYGRSQRLMAVPFDLGTLTVQGRPVSVLDNVQRDDDSPSMSYAFSPEGTLAYVPGTGSNDNTRSVLEVDLLGQTTAFIDEKRGFELARYSPDGNYVAFLIRDNNDDVNIWIYHVEGGAFSQLTFYEGPAILNLAWSPDSRKLAYATKGEDDAHSIYIRNVDGTGVAQQIYTSPLEREMYVTDWSSDGDKIVFDQMAGSTGFDLFVYSFQDSSAAPYYGTAAFEAEPFFSPNSKWMVYMANPAPAEVYVRPYPDPSGGLWKISNGGGVKPLWSPDGTTIYYANDHALYAVDVTATDVFSKGNPRKLFEGNYFLPRERRFDIHPDGDRFIMLQGTDEDAVAKELLVIQHFTKEVKRLAPANRDQ